MLRSRSRDRRSGPPAPVFMSPEQMNEYLHDLRTNRPARPTGARPPPSSFRSIPSNAPSFATGADLPTGRSLGGSSPPASLQSLHRKATSLSANLGRPVARAPSDADSIARGDRGESHALRVAMEKMDLEEEQKLHAAAQAEASDLVWKHQNPNAPYPYAASQGPGSRYKRFSTGSRSIGDLQSSMKKTRGDGGSSRSVSGSSSSASSRAASDSSMKSVDSKRSDGRKRSVQFAVEDKVVEIEKESPAPLRKPAPKQADQLDNPVAEKPSSVSPTHFRNPFSRVRNSRQSLSQSSSTSPAGLFWKAREKVEIQNNPPSRSRNPSYTINPATGSMLELESTIPREDVKMKDGKEIRGDDIRKATSMSLRDRSPKLPIPAVVSDKPGRPIVSFDSNWRPKEVNMQEGKGEEDFRPSRPMPSIDTSRPAPTQLSQIPVINLPDEEPPRRQQTQPSVPIPTINFPTDPPTPPAKRSMPSIPTISVDASPPPSRPIPTISVEPSAPAPLPTIAINDSTPDPPRSTRPLPTPSKPAASPHASRATHSPALARSKHGSAIQCHACALPIEARFVTAAGARFHPACFRCVRCAEHLECVAFYPEPEEARARRVEEEGPMDGDLRFYCHLDFHELFSPRCKSCKTPIEGEVVVACGAEWHAGHFFCAQCGDPFDAQTPYVEKDGYAWCVDCHTKRFSTKCKKCRKPVVDTVINALDAEWHEECFCCVDCGSPFKDGRYFLRQGCDDPFCSECEEKRLKA